ncbi:MAG TPA: amino acid permease, partial [Micromonosporaceae bacterium]|nr:amino acid permease [Micromonosporaceae bacterium]
MASPTSLLKRLLLGRPFRTDRLQHTLLPKRIALPVFASDPLSSVAYAPEQIFLVLSVAGIGAYSYGPWIGLLIAVVLVAVVASYRQNVRAYQSGGGDYEVANVNHGRGFGLAVASALLVDYVLTVAVSISAAAANVGSAVPFVEHHRVSFSLVAIALLTAVNLRGVKESGTAFAVPTYGFVVGILGLVGYGLFRIYLLGDPLRAESAQFGLRAEDAHLAGLAFVFLLMRTFSSGCAALTGVEAIANGVPAFRPPKGKNAATTL